MDKSVFYTHKVQYYETDKMGITHHSNYVRWMEEARIEYLKMVELDYKTLESEGLISPVVAINCRYKNTTSFDDKVTICVKIKEFKGVKLIFEYEMTKEGKPVLTATSEHCCVNENGNPVILKKDFPKYDEILRSLAQDNAV